MSKLLKIGIPILVVVLALSIGFGLALANGDDTPAVTNKAVSYQAGYSWCPQQCQGPQGCLCPQKENCAANCYGKYGNCINSANCPQAGYCQGYCGRSGDTANQPRCGDCWQ